MSNKNNPVAVSQLPAARHRCETQRNTTRAVGVDTGGSCLFPANILRGQGSGERLSRNPAAAGAVQDDAYKS